MPNTILLKSAGDWRYDEGRAAAQIYPGMLIARNNANALIPHPTVGGAGLAMAEVMIAIEDSLGAPSPTQGPFFGRMHTDPYVIGDIVRYLIAKPGDEFLMRLINGTVATVAQNVAINDPLTSNGDGNLRKTAVAADFVLFRANEAFDNSGGGAPAFLRVRCVI